MSNPTVQQVFANLREIVKNDALQHEGYCTNVVAPERAESICGGRNACMLGSLWIAAGIKPNLSGAPFLPGVYEGQRGDVLTDNPVLRAVYDALNAVALPRVRRYAGKRGMSWPDSFVYEESAAEAYFEECYPSRRSIRSLFDRAEELLNA